MSNSLVSIGIIAYNQASFIAEALDAALAQSYANCEIVVGDDGSRDGTDRIINEFASRYPGRIKAITGLGNVGITGNSNRVLSACSGTYVVLQGGDDIMLPSKIAEQVAFMEAHPECALSFHDVEIFRTGADASSELWGVRRPPRYGHVSDVIRLGTFMCACSVMWRRSLSGGGFDSRLPVVSDWMFWIDILSSGGSYAYIDKVLARYRRHSNNASAAVGERKIISVRDCWDTVSAVIVKYPDYSNDALFAYARLLADLRYVYPDQYVTLVVNSLRIRPRLKTVTMLLIYAATFGAVRR